MRKTLLPVVTAFIALTTKAETGTFEFQGLTFTLDEIEMTASLTGWNLSDTELTIPSIVSRDGREFTVTEISSRAFMNSDVTGQLVLPSTIKNIGNRTFYNCTGITEIIIPENVEFIGDDCFNLCTNVYRLAIDCQPEYECTHSARGGADTYAFHNMGGNADTFTIEFGKNVKNILKQQFMNVAVTKLVFDAESMLESIGQYAFSSTQLKGDIYLPANLKSIGNNAFSNTGIETLTLPENMESIEYSAFANCKDLRLVTLNSINVAAGTSTNTVLRNSGQDAGGYEVVIGENVEMIPMYMFANSNVKSIKFPENGSLKVINYEAFYNNPTLTGELIIPDYVSTIGQYAFSNCSLTSVYIGKNITSIDKYSFDKNPTLSEINFNAEKCGKQAISFTAHQKWADGGKSRAEDNSDEDSINFIIGPDVKVLPARLFSEAYDSFHIDLTGASSLEEIGEGCFSYATATYESLELPSSLQKIGENAFAHKASAKVRLPASLTEMGKGCFNGITATSFAYDRDFTTKELTDTWLTIDGPVTVGKAVTGIEANFFSNSRYNITGVAFEEGSQLEWIGDNVFKGYNLGSLSLPNAIKNLGKSVFEGCEVFGELILPEAIENIGEKAFKDCGFTGQLNLPDNLAKIDDFAFSGCAGLEGVLTIPASLTYMGWDAFANCNFHEVIIDDSPMILEFGDDFNPSGGWIVSSVSPGGGTRADVMSGEGFRTGLFAKMPLKKITLGRNISYLEGAVMQMGITRFYFSPFNGIENLENIVLRGNFSQTGRHFIHGAGCVKEIECLMTTPPDADETSFAESDISGCVLRVPLGCVQAYSMAPVWRDFYITDGVEAGVDSVIDIDSANARYYNLKGMKTDASAHGIKIIIAPDGSVRKMIK